ncbi:MAG: type II secretion system protein GspL [Rudaea sp.]
MSERLLIRLRADGQMQWLATDAQGAALSGANAGTPPVQALARAQHIVVLAPAEDVLLLDTPALPGARAQTIRALPFALEDRLASPVEDLHFAVPERVQGGRITVAVVARATLRHWLARLAQAGIRVDALFAESQALAYAESGCVVLDGERALWRSSADRAGACAVADLPAWLELLASDDTGAKAWDVFDFRDAPPLALARVRYHAGQRDVLAFFAMHLRVEPAINLLQGEFAPAHLRAPAQRLWRNAAALAVAALVLLFAYYGADCWRLARQSARLDAAAHALLHSAFPEMDKVAGDPRQLMQSALRGMQGSGGTDLMSLLARIAPILASTTRTALTGMEYHNATLELALRAPDVPTLDLMRERLANLPGVKVEVTAANTGADGVDGRLRISRSAP